MHVHPTRLGMCIQALIPDLMVMHMRGHVRKQGFFTCKRSVRSFAALSETTFLRSLEGHMPGVASHIAAFGPVRAQDTGTHTVQGNLLARKQQQD